MGKLGMPLENYEVTGTLFETADARLLALAGARSSSSAHPVQVQASERVFQLPASGELPSTSFHKPIYYGSFRQPSTRAVQPSYQTDRLPLYENGYPTSRQEQSSSGIWGTTVAVSVAFLTGIGLLIGWFYG